MRLLPTALAQSSCLTLLMLPPSQSLRYAVTPAVPFPQLIVSQKIKWLLFDCDNTLVLSEGLAGRVCYVLVNEVLAYKGIEHRYVDDELLIHFMGLPFKGMCVKMAKDFGYEWTDRDKAHFEKREEEECIKIFKKDLTALPGIFNTLVRVVRELKWNIAVVSSSSKNKINACLEKTNLDMFFLPQYIFSATDSMEKKITKPDPAIYLHAMKELGVKPEDCVCIEDSRAGVKAAVAAGVPCIGLLQSYNGAAKQEQLVTDFQKDGVAAIMWNWSEFFTVLDRIENM